MRRRTLSEPSARNRSRLRCGGQNGGVLLRQSRRRLEVGGRAQHDLIDGHTVLTPLYADGLWSGGGEIDGLTADANAPSIVMPSPARQAASRALFNAQGDARPRTDAPHGLARGVYRARELRPYGVVRPGVRIRPSAHPQPIGFAGLRVEPELEIVGRAQGGHGDRGTAAVRIANPVAARCCSVLDQRPCADANGSFRCVEHDGAGAGRRWRCRRQTAVG